MFSTEEVITAALKVNSATKNEILATEDVGLIMATL